MATISENRLAKAKLIRNIDTVELTAVNVRKIIEELTYLAANGYNVNNNSEDYQDGLPTALHYNIYEAQVNSMFWVLEDLKYVYKSMSRNIHAANKIKFKNEAEVRENLKLIFGKLKHYSNANITKKEVNRDVFYDYEIIGTDSLLAEREKLVKILKSTKDFKKNKCKNCTEWDTTIFQKIDKLPNHSEKWLKNRAALMEINAKIHKSY